MRTRIIAAMSAMFVGVTVLLGIPAEADAQTSCPGGRPIAGDLGIERYRCVGGACEIWVPTPLGLTHVFTTEPRIDRMDPAGPAVGQLEVDDVLVAVDGLLITTAAAGRRLAHLQPGVPVRLWVRRDGLDARVEVTPRPGCGPQGLTVRVPGAP